MSFDAEQPDEQKKGTGDVDRSQGAARAISVSFPAASVPHILTDVISVVHRPGPELEGPRLVQEDHQQYILPGTYKSQC